MKTIVYRAMFFHSNFSIPLIFIFLIIAGATQAQKTHITIKVINVKKEPVSFVSLTIAAPDDSTQMLSNITDSTGTFEVDLTYGRYIISGSSVNYLPFKKGITVKNDQAVFILTAQAASLALKEVVITASKPVMRQEDDKTIVDPENLASSSTNAYEILEKIPGLFVDQDGNIYINSTTPATVYINGREQKLSASDIATMLKNLPPNAIASIEILRTPSAKYDASGSGGIVNVVLKKGVKPGLTGSVTVGGNQGKYGRQFVGLNFNNNNGKTSTYVNMQFSSINNYEQVKTDRLFDQDSLLSQDALTLYSRNNYYVGFGVNFVLKKKWDLSLDSRINYTDFKNSTTNFSFIKKVTTDVLKTNNNTNINNNGNTFSFTQEASVKYKIDTSGSEWTTDLSYNLLADNSNQTFSTNFLYPAINPLSGDGILKADLNVFAAQSNLLFKLPKKVTIETGLKTSISGFKNTTNYFKQLNTEVIKDIGRTSAYNYNENINAAYLQASKNIKGIVVKAGLRVENTNMKGNQFIPADTSFSIHRTDLFPYVYISRNLFKIMSYELKAYLVYRRTISRPGYQLLNPSQRYVDQYLFETGNPSLRPQFTQNYEANVSVDERPVVAIGVNDTKDIFTNVIYQADSSRSTAYRTYDNLGNNKEIYFRALGALPPGKKYFIVAGIQYNRNFYQGLYEGIPLLFKKASWSIFTYQTLKLTPATQLTLNGFARFKGQLQFYELSSFGSLNLSVNQQLMRKKLIISASVNDLFLTNHNSFTIKQGIVNANGFRKADTRRFGFNVRYNFGLRKKENNDILDEVSPEKNN